jgi:hypothetical protein
VDTDGPAFKFLMTKKGKQHKSANGGEKSLTLDYGFRLHIDSYYLLTVTDSYITKWSSLSAQQKGRYHNLKTSPKSNIQGACFFLDDGKILMYDKLGDLYVGDVDESAQKRLHKDQRKNEEVQGLAYMKIFSFTAFLGNIQGFKITQLATHKLQNDVIFVATTHGKPYNSSLGLYVFRVAQTDFRR